ncbi:MAG: LuxR C-terminal-related transcriptional regulator, partial [Solirubrobacteraceae bacterium]|nr:LuxR C-terminal-related transcriptional regulator [Patulibacter sp.]
VERIAHHVERSAASGDTDAAATLVTAARSVAPRAPATAASWLRTALAIDRTGSAAERTSLMVELAKALQASGRHHRARDVLLEATEVVDPDAVAQRIEISAALAAVEHGLGHPDTARVRLQSMLDGLPADVPAELRARLTFQLAFDAAYIPDLEGLRRLAGTSAPVLRETEPALAICDDALAILGASWYGHGEEIGWRSAAVHGQIEALGERFRHRRAFVGYVVGSVHLATQDLDRASEMVAYGTTALRDAPDETAFVSFMAFAALVAIARGQVPAAREATVATEEAARLQGGGTGLAQALGMRASVALLDGDLEDAARAAAEWPEVAERLDRFQISRVSHAYFALIRAIDDPAGGAAAIREHMGRDLEFAEPEYAARKLGPQYVRLLLALDERAEAERVTAAIEANAARHDLPVSRSGALLARAELRLTGGDPMRALDGALHAAELAASRGYLYERFWADVVAARALSVLDRRDEAVDRLRAQATRVAEGGAWALRDAAARELRRLGSRLPTVLRARGEEGELTDRERQIAELVAAGRTNKEVGRMLFLSPKTVEHSLSRIYAKLTIRGRGELAAAMAAAGGAA